MKFLVSKKHFVDALQRMKEVATKGLKVEFELAHRVTIESSKNVLHFFASNGHLNVKYEVTSITDSNLACPDHGTITVDAVVAHAVVSAIGGSTKDIILSCELDGETLLIKDANSKAKKSVKLQTLKSHHKFTIKKPTDGFAFNISLEQYKDGVLGAVPYASRMGYKVRYQMVCLHFLKKETRFVCGDGQRFWIYTSQLDKPNAQITDDDGVRYLLPADQASIIGNILDGAAFIDFVYADEQTCYIKPHSALEMMLVGIPNQKYVPYEKHLFSWEQARIIADVPSASLRESVGILGAIKDKERESQDQFQTCQFAVRNNELCLTVDEGSYQCDLSYAIDAYSVNGDTKYSSLYAGARLADAARIADKSIVRFYCIDPKRSIVLESIEPSDKRNADGVPEPKIEPGDPRVMMFFTALLDDSATNEHAAATEATPEVVSANG